MTQPRALLDELRSRAEAFPLPHPSWHPHARAMRACRDDFARALDVAERLRQALDLVAAALAGELEQPFAAGDVGPLAGAYERLGRLALPAGEHPYLDEIVETMEAMEATLVALSLVPRAAAAYPPA